VKKKNLPSTQPGFELTGALNLAAAVAKLCEFVASDVQIGLGAGQGLVGAREVGDMPLGVGLQRGNLRLELADRAAIIVCLTPRLVHLARQPLHRGAQGVISASRTAWFRM
jgi:hypothetical protein